MLAGRRGSGMEDVKEERRGWGLYRQTGLSEAARLGHRAVALLRAQKSSLPCDIS
jgi:hypothetical protein